MLNSNVLCKINENCIALLFSEVLDLASSENISYGSLTMNDTRG